VAWLDVEAFDCCTCLYVCIASTVCDFLISVIWDRCFLAKEAYFEGDGGI